MATLASASAAGAQEAVDPAGAAAEEPDPPVLAAVDPETPEVVDEDGATAPDLSPGEGPRRSEELDVAHRALQVSTAGALVATAVFGALQAYNVPTSFGDGACASSESDPIFDDYACGRSLSVLHGILGITTLVLYSATTTVGLVAPPEDREPAAGVLGWVHGIGFALTGLAGILGRYPDVIGVDPEEQADFSRHTRTVHMGLAVTTATAFVTQLLIELID